ncbi:TetR/AcrR family transcriptional regulator [Aneurinibacillus migulanus]|uniref:TetR family transcriptional regulator n=1 Tax=Aneurinibacillus migulanus TaxID=47500 RepID=A0A0D1VEB9_ANEMI|nr:TetR/AcrR family transcriptional regulator [Aneurinibacillus migulanus]KIV57794.1 TetR family transcriptional regulator [Aneurinibacillus migulanus]KON97036.1 TetR family transcriptional regulator [Aneurinibacillus migulanus]MED0896017.1 TetR/AcrR family transcriptional regulator [Aneurinibacillus migulanus]MED1618499.1 TetR/AcrR family transcriptional regulator [Aneurinibacillus migulanus]SDJ63446.1 transcriptional regulator, TetR family [Aneurinibacillus migulanus]
MPKLIDHEKRRKQIAEATWRVILEQGMEGATVRKIAKEAGLSLGALRHYFSTQDELLVYAMQLVKEKATARITEIAMQDLPPKEKILNIMLQIVPVNDETMAEMEVWFAFTAHFRHKQDTFDAQHDRIFVGMQKIIDYLDQFNLLQKNLDKEIEAEKLYALIDGLALHMMLEPQRVNKDRIVRVLVHHLNSICVGEPDE